MNNVELQGSVILVKLEVQSAMQRTCTVEWEVMGSVLVPRALRRSVENYTASNQDY